MNLSALFASMAFACSPLNSSESSNIQQLDVSGKNFCEYVLKDVNHCLFSVLWDSVPNNHHEVLYVINNDSTEEKVDKSAHFSVEILSELYDNFTFQKYSEKPWVHWYASITYPQNSDMNITLSESVYYTPEKSNPMCANFVTDLIWSYDINKKISVWVWTELSVYPKQKDDNMFAGFLMADYHPNDRFSVNLVTYKPFCSLDWKWLSNLYLLGTFTYNISDKSLILRTMTSCEDGWKTKFAFGFSSPIWKNVEWELTFKPGEKTWVPDEKVWVVPNSVVCSLKYTF